MSIYSEGSVQVRIFDRSWSGEWSVSSIAEALGVGRVARLRQVHGVQIQDVGKWTEAAWQGSMEEGDALIWGGPEEGGVRGSVALAIATADCVPVLAWNTNSMGLGAAHLGWRGAWAGLVPLWMQALKQKTGGSSQGWKACLGPAIQQVSYEVGQEFYESWQVRWPGSRVFFQKASRGEGWQFNLPGWVVQQGEEAGFEWVWADFSRADTFSQPEQYPSYRRETQRHQPPSGERLWSTVCWRE